MVNELLIRGIANIYPSREIAKQMLEAGKPLRVYLGIDPTGAELHLGHTAGLFFLKRLLDLRHKPIFLIGDFTSRIGDPTDKDASRKQLTAEDVARNMATYWEQVGKILPLDRIEKRMNSEWWGPMHVQEFMEIKSLVTVQQLLTRDMFQKRIADGAPIHDHEIDYPLLQGYDTVAMDADGEVGGNDQTFNMLMGRDLLKKFKNREKLVFSMKLIEDSATGKKMSKTEGNYISITSKPTDMFGGIMALSDGLILPLYESVTVAPMSVVEDARKRLEVGENPKIIKEELAYEIVRFYHGDTAARAAQEEFKNVFTTGSLPTEIPTHASGDIVEIMVSAKLASSKTEAKRLIDEKAVKINDIVIDSWDAKAKPGDVLRVGPRKFLKII